MQTISQKPNVLNTDFPRTLDFVPRSGQTPKSDRTLYFDYQDSDGHILYTVIRKEFADGSKKISQDRPGGTKAHIPYHLPDVLRVVANKGLIILTEGEKKANRLIHALRQTEIANSVVAVTCNDGGAGNWRDEQSAYLAGANVVILPDNDDPGNGHAETAARYLRAAGAASVKRIDLPDLLPKGDVYDWLEAGHTVENLLSLIAGAVEYYAPAEPEKAPARPRVPLSADQSDRQRDSARKAAQTSADTLARLGDGRFAGLKRYANFIGMIAGNGFIDDSEGLNLLYQAIEANGYTTKKSVGQKIGESQARFYFEKGRSHPEQLDLADFDRTERAEIGEIAASGPQVDQVWGNALSDGWRAVLMHFWGKQGPAICQALDAVLESVGTSEFTLRELSERSGITYKKLWRAFEVYGLSRLCAANSRITSDLIYQGQIEELALHAHSGICLSTTGKSETYRLPSPGEVRDYLKQEIMVPALVKKHYKIGPDEIPAASLDLFSLVGADDPALPQAINAGLKITRTDQESRARHAAASDLKRWLARLDDTSPAPLPDIARKDYRGAIALQNAEFVIETQQSWAAAERETGMDRRTLRNVERRIGIKREEVFHPDGQILEPGVKLPDVAFDPVFRGVPVKAITESGEIFDLRGEEGHRKTQAALDGGERVKLDYQQASRVLRMSEDEIAAAHERKTAKKPTETTITVKTTDNTPRVPEIGYTLAFLLSWLTACEQRFGLSSDVTLTPRVRVYRLAAHNGKLPTFEAVQILPALERFALLDVLGEAFETDYYRWHEETFVPIVRAVYQKNVA